MMCVQIKNNSNILKNEVFVLVIPADDGVLGVE